MLSVKFVPERPPCYGLNLYLKRPPTMLSVKFLPKKAPPYFKRQFFTQKGPHVMR